MSGYCDVAPGHEAMGQPPPLLGRHVEVKRELLLHSHFFISIVAAADEEDEGGSDVGDEPVERTHRSEPL